MDVITHTAIAVSCMAACYAWGRYLSRNEVLHEIVSTLLDRLEKDGYVHTVEGEDGDMELVPISEIIEKSKKNA